MHSFLMPEQRAWIGQKLWTKQSREMGLAVFVITGLVTVMLVVGHYEPYALMTTVITAAVTMVLLVGFVLRQAHQFKQAWLQAARTPTPVVAFDGVVYRNNKTRRMTFTSIQIDDNTVWRFGSIIIQDTWSKPGDPVTVELYGQDRWVPAAYMNHNAGRMNASMVKIPREARAQLKNFNPPAYGAGTVGLPTRPPL